ncbi:DUF2254 domain-containing protein [Aequorivita lipolytica]|uniref:DUF2254 domain-containing protein n=1 Tax=Aequorivita lipolytica TaxID=153267 RepID=A0A5C6YMJ5_9FLAO|nr:DUF2254 domain-containing protein [Aequorivita lipolytica]TXD68140.1 DUF2254 domain-containing protein [Aequorivita lipolytica]SRX53566.1 hypothetical protein AEQU2_02798 [Aequorivita lipolytica]
MKHFLIRIATFFRTVQSKIAFYPTLIAIAGFCLALGMIILEQYGVSRKIIEIFPLLMVEDGDTALNVLSTCIGGLISMMVFSFSMVMLLLSQASSNFSPRLLPGLISNKRHQIILGFFLATIIYNIFTLFSVDSGEEKYMLPGFSILLGVFFTILALSAFIFFIHNISQSIQINNIMDGIYDQAIHRLNEIIDAEEKDSEMLVSHFPDTSEWHSYTSPQSGYFQNISIKNITDICKKNDVRVYITSPKGLFVLKNNSILKASKVLDDKVIGGIFSNINFARGEYIRDNYILAFKQITEIAVKAMSPGINDPGTAVNAIDYLTELFALRMKKNNTGVLTADGKTYIKIAIIHFEELLYNVMASLRTYCKHDPIVVQKLIWMLKYLQDQPAADETYTTSIKEELKVLIHDMDFDSKKDERILRKLAETKKDL